MSHAPNHLSLEEYLEAEPRSEVRHEYVRGVVYAMAGASADHGLIVMSIGSQLRAQLRGSRCRAFTSDLRVMLKEGLYENYYYPDALVECSGTRGNFTTEPKVIFEVLSPSAERIDREEKLASYRQFPSLLAYVLVNQASVSVITYRRTPESSAWQMEFLADPEATLLLPEIGCLLPLREIYEGTAALEP